jgi:hypothetical protein
MKRLAPLFALLLATPAGAQDFTQGSTAEEWGLYAESKALFAATVVDPLCELAGDCPADCGGGTRQLALRRTVDGVMVMPLKNGQPLFTGAANELAPFCGREVEVDGLLLADPDAGFMNLYQVQKIRVAGTSDWIRANRWTEDWAARNPDAAGEGEWFRRDPRVKAEIAREGYLGLGLETDAAFLKEYFQ